MTSPATAASPAPTLLMRPTLAPVVENDTSPPPLLTPIAPPPLPSTSASPLLPPVINMPSPVNFSPPPPPPPTVTSPPAPAILSPSAISPPPIEATFPPPSSPMMTSSLPEPPELSLTIPPPPPPSLTITVPPIASPPPPPFTPSLSPPPPFYTPGVPPDSPPQPPLSNPPTSSQPPHIATLPKDPPPSAVVPPPPSPFPPISGSVISPPPIAPANIGGSPSRPSNPSNLVTGLIVGITTGGVLLLVVFGVLCFCLMKRRKLQRFAMDYYQPSCSGDRESLDNYYAAVAQHKHQKIASRRDHVITMLTKPSLWPPLGRGNGGFKSNSNCSGYENLYSPKAPGVALGYSSSIFSYEELAIATGGFSEANLLGQGGFGYVHKGILHNGKEVAIKKLKIGSSQGEREFQAEVETISRVHHKHLVSLVGYCITGAERLLCMSLFLTTPWSSTYMAKSIL